LARRRPLNAEGRWRRAASARDRQAVAIRASAWGGDQSVDEATNSAPNCRSAGSLLTTESYQRRSARDIPVVICEPRAA
jgi:hypothetical protein